MDLQHLINHCTGWIKDQRVVEEHMKTLPKPMLCDYNSAIRGTGEGKTVILCDYVRQLNNGIFNVRTQEDSDCTSMATAAVVDSLKSVEIVLKGDWEEWAGETATEFFYGCSRIQVGGGNINGAGSFGIWTAKAANLYGSLIRKKYDDIDLTTYDVNKVRNWARNGVPKKLLPYAKEHLVNTISMVTTYVEARDCLNNGYPISVCSSQGFTNVRDNLGFASPRGTWPHAMAVLGFSDNRNRPGVLIQNSWGENWITGPKVFNQPDGSFFVDAEVFESMLAENDSFAYSSFAGYIPQNLNLRLL